RPGDGRAARAHWQAAGPSRDHVARGHSCGHRRRPGGGRRRGGPRLVRVPGRGRAGGLPAARAVGRAGRLLGGQLPRRAVGVAPSRSGAGRARPADADPVLVACPQAAGLRPVRGVDRPSYTGAMTENGQLTHPADDLGVSAPAPSTPAGAPVDLPTPAGPGEQRVVVAAPRGYCAGVDRAVITVEKALERYGPPVYVRKQIVHNKHVVETLSERGAVFVEELDEVPEGATTVFSAHGVSPMVRDQAAQRNLQTIDATCPLVTKVHNEARRFARDDMEILLIGHDGHEEVEGTSGEAPEHITLVQSPDEVDQVEVRDPSKVAWLSQTTLSVDETMETVRRLREKFPLLQDPPSDDICYATSNRQAAVKQIAAHSDLVIVVGSANSSNSVRLVEVALEAGAKAAHRVDNADEV